MEIVNDRHGGMNRTAVRRIHRPATAGALQRLVADAGGRSGGGLSVCGRRHAMGGQAFCAGADLVDMSGLTRVLRLDEDRGLVTVEAGITWPVLMDELAARQRRRSGTRGGNGSGQRWGIVQKQTGTDDLSVGGALAVNAHGRGLNLAPMVQDVEAVEVVLPDGEVVRASRTENHALFRHVIGGYGLFGVMLTATLRLAERRRVRRRVVRTDLQGAVTLTRAAIAAGCVFGDFQFEVDPASGGFLDGGVLSVYEPVADDGRSGSADDAGGDGADAAARAEWLGLMHLAHVDKSRAFAMYAERALAGDGRVVWSDEQQRSTYVDGYHAALAMADPPCPGGEMLTELFVPPEGLTAFAGEAAEVVRRRGGDVVYGTVRLARADRETALPWAPEDRACVVMNLHVDPTEAAAARAAETVRGLIDAAVRAGGGFYLTYHRWATAGQLLRAYPGLPAWLAVKDELDPGHVLTSDWHAWLRGTLGM